MNKEFYVIGQMSGTSLDGLDLVYVKFFFRNKWNFEIINAKTYKYPEQWTESLKQSICSEAYELIALDRYLGDYIGESINQFIKEFNIAKVDFIGSHGHTVFHQPQEGVTLQLGNGANIAAVTGIKTYFDFRNLDVALGGQGAPLVPIGDKLLFSEYDYCLNLGGFANISYKKNNTVLAFDICPANIVLNYLANNLGLDYDNNGEKAMQGRCNESLFCKLNDVSFYAQKPPKSLGKEWLDQNIIPILDKYDIAIEDKLHTFCKHIAYQISKVSSSEPGSILITGGGAYNKALIDFLKSYVKNMVIIPENTIVDYKEALIFAFLAVLRNQGIVNCLSSVTGARADSICGIECLPVR